MIRSLVVEDLPPSREYLRRCLEILDIDAVEADNGENALEVLNEEDVDLMLLDIALGPGMDGVTLCEEVRRHPKYSNTLAIAVTAFPPKNFENADATGFNDYIIKPYSLDDLKNTLAKHNALPQQGIPTQNKGITPSIG
jgi:CheY-like chemotaxis protein